ncbi:titin [Nephila pilipes]|uniref:Titin n=1 Tax=Nephila pilipes TaxID=299642 RepID=A0A8X6R2C9_NEPPI|nr:titin [Nephila pilipes]
MLRENTNLCVQIASINMRFNCLYLFASTVIHTIVVAVNESPKIWHIYVPSLVELEAPIIQPFSLPERIQIGRSLSLSCAVMSGTPPLNFKWYKNQKLLQTENIKSSNKKVSFLMIDPIVENSGGNYSCLVSNSNGQTQFSAVLVVTAPPIWITEPENEEIVENERLNLKCIANGSPNPKITWKKLDNSQNGEISTSLNLKSENGSLILDPILKIHEGNYMCIADNGAGNPLKKTVMIVVREFPEIQPFQFPQYIQIGYKASVICSVRKGGSPLSFIWYKNGRILKESTTINVESNEKFSALHLDPIEDTSVGNYTCVVSNPFGKDNHTAFLSVKAPPTWIKEPENAESIEGENINIPCIATGSPPPNIRMWKLDDTEMKYSHRSVNGSLLFKPIQKFHEGKYACEADNGVGSVLKKTFSLIVYDAPKIQPFQFPSQIKRGDTASITCALMRGSHPVKFTWIKDGKPLENRLTANIISNEDLSNLIIKSVDENSVGNYTCIASSSFGNDNFTAILKVKVPPSWIKEPQDVEIIEGQNAKFSCLARGSPNPSFEWRKIGKETIQLPRFGQDVSNGTLIFNPALKNDDGSYECRVRNGIGESLSKVVLLIVHDSTPIACLFIWILLSNHCGYCNESPRIQPFQFPQNIQLGDKTSVICMIMRGQSSTTYEWYKDNKLLKKSENVNIESNDMFSTLMIDPVEETSVGNYTCRAENSIGRDSNSAFLFVKTPPFWLKEAESSEAIEGQSINITCSASGYPLPQVSILKEDEITTNDGAASVSSSNRTASTANLVLHPVLKVHSGKYACKAENGFGTPLKKIISVFIYGSKDKIQPFIFPQKIREGESTKVMCTINSEDKTFTFKWLKDGIHIKDSNRIEISVLTDVSLLKIKSVSTQDSGNYTCIASSQQNTLNYTTTLLVEAPVQWTAEPIDQEVILGEDVKFFCSARGFPAPVIKWHKAIGEQEYQVETSNRFRVDTEGTLIISNVQGEDGAIYICYARNGVGNSLQKKVSLSVIEFSRIGFILDMFYAIIILTASWIAVNSNDAPEIHPFHPSAKLKIGDSASFFCSVTRGQVPLSFKWYKNGQLLKNNSKEIQNNEKFSTLVIDSVTAISAGNYTCVVSNSFGKSSYSTLLVVRSPPYWIKEPEDVEIVEGSTVTLFCNAGGTPQPKITWRKMGETQNKDYFKYVTGSDNNGSLLLHPAMKEHEGIYTCEVNNDVGETLKKQATVIVHGNSLSSLIFLLVF